MVSFLGEEGGIRRSRPCANWGFCRGGEGGIVFVTSCTRAAWKGFVLPQRAGFQEEGLSSQLKIGARCTQAVLKV
jgi:hypothetical protein